MFRRPSRWHGVLSDPPTAPSIQEGVVPVASPAFSIPGMAKTASGTRSPKTRFIALLTRPCSCRAAALVGTAKYSPSTRPAKKKLGKTPKRSLGLPRSGFSLKDDQLLVRPNLTYGSLCRIWLREVRQLSKGERRPAEQIFHIKPNLD